MAIDAGRDALVVVDVQNDFCPGGSLAVPEGDRVVPVLNRYIARFAVARADLRHARLAPGEDEDFQAYGGVWPPHCVQGTPGAAFHAALGLPGEATVVSKGTEPEQDAYSAFQAEDEAGKSFAARWRRVACGAVRRAVSATDDCVKATVLDARRRGSTSWCWPTPSGGGREPGDGERALEEMRAAGARLATLGEV